MRRATVVAVPSEYVRSTVIDAFGTDPDAVVVVPHGLDPPAPDAVTDAASLRQRYGIGDRRFVVYPAITHPHKNHRLLLDLLAGPWNDPAWPWCCSAGAASPTTTSPRGSPSAASRVA